MIRFAEFKRFLKGLLEPTETQMREITREDLTKALESQSVRVLWMDKVVGQLTALNMEVDGLLAKEDRSRVWGTYAIERRTLLAVLRMIMDAQSELDSEQAAQEQRDRVLRAYQGASAPINLDVRVNSEGQS